jgi:hypothetical protein
MMQLKVFNFYIDDTGTKEMSDIKNVFFAYIGLILNSKYENTIVDCINEIKYKYFSSSEVELKSNWLRIPSERFKRYIKPYGITERQLFSFTVDLFKEIVKLPIHCIGSVIDEDRLARKYKKVVFDPSPLCYELLLQRVANYATQYSIDLVNIFFDDMSGKNLTGSEWKNLLNKQHSKLKKGYSPLYRNWINRSKMNYARICKEIKFIDSRASTLIQLADLCAYNVMRQSRERWCCFDYPPYYKGYSWILPIMHRDPITGKIFRFGVINFPKDEKIVMTRSHFV